ncbi:thiamine phosphate synthase [Limoniibacter endophyticus]|uniref:Thiamine-phosphate synthase n=1 Tax=Limoniibacter endophyticus TaxID=1565040 RepID=A0A8J3DQS5_9HYPH|nr:thiamine phosphate synthase [Limoniibacter endophyticus]GHC67545.1 thiamine-phosphate synthase [Limoniibacter endophyticus]
MAKVDYRLNGIVDVDNLGGENLPVLARLAADNGVTILQYRDKNSDTRAMIERAREIRAALAGTGVPLLINDRVDVALAAEADGVHIGQEDMTPADARALLGPDRIIGLTVKNEADGQAARSSPIDYACAGGVFATASKENPDKPIGTEGLRKIIAQIKASRPDMPVGAIAGIDLSNVPEVIAAGADGIAVISAIFRAQDPAKAARDLRHAVDRALSERAS